MKMMIAMQTRLLVVFVALIQVREKITGTSSNGGNIKGALEMFSGNISFLLLARDDAEG